MQSIGINYNGKDELCRSRYSLRSSVDPDFLLNVDTFFNGQNLPHKRACGSSSTPRFQPGSKSIEALPDECLFETLRRLAGRERCTCASVSKRWLKTLTTIAKPDLCHKSLYAELMEYKNVGLFTMELSGGKVTDTKLAAIAVCTATRGGLGKLFIQGNESSRVTNQGLKDIARGCSSLKVLSVTDISSIGDEGLCEIANGCRLLKELELINISSIGNDGLIAIAEKCPELKFLTLDSCANVGNETLQALARVCSQLESITIKDCPLIGDLGVTSLLSPPIPALTKVKLHGLMISDVTLASIDLYHSPIKNLSLNRINAVTKKGFWAMAEGLGLRSITSLTVSSCYCMTDQILEVFGRSFPGLKQLFLWNCWFLSDFGLVSFSKSATGLESLELESCNRITLEGVKHALSNFHSQLKSFRLVRCDGIQDMTVSYDMVHPCRSLQSISVKECDAFGSVALILLGKLCPKLQHLELNGLHKITDDGLVSFLESHEARLETVNFQGCINLSHFRCSCDLAAVFSSQRAESRWLRENH
ncbi:hypothetical protein Drorol1_Dr00015834 [Drosera rotundifolia]